MEANLVELDRVTFANEYAQESARVFLAGSSASLAALAPDSASEVLAGLVVAATFSSFEGSLSSANLSLVHDLRLRTELGAWLGQANDVAEDGPYLIQGNLELSEMASPAGAMRAMAGVVGLVEDSDPPSSVLSRLREEVGFVDAILRYWTLWSIDIAKVAPLRETTEGILSRLQAAGR